MHNLDSLQVKPGEKIYVRIDAGGHPAAQLLALANPQSCRQVEMSESTRIELRTAYMNRWDKRSRALEADNRWRLTHESRIDENGVLTDWEWWGLIDSGLQGAALVLTGDTGVQLERITYFDRNLRQAKPT